MNKSIIAVMIAGVIFSMTTLGCRKSNETGVFYLRACDTGRLIGPIELTTGYRLPPLDGNAYIVAKPAKSELEVRKNLLESVGYESRYIDCIVEDVVKEMNLSFKHRMGDKAPPVRAEGVEDLITMDIGDEESAYDILCKIAAKTNAHIFIEDGMVVLSRKKYPELSTF